MMGRCRWSVVLGVVALVVWLTLAALPPTGSPLAAIAMAAKPVYWWFDVDVTGDIALFATSPTGLPADADADAVPAIGHATVRNGVGDNVVVNRPSPCLDLSFLEDHFNGVEDGMGTTCFGPDGIVYYGTLGVWETAADDGTRLAMARYWFRATGKDGQTEIQYYLEMYGVVVGESWLPDTIGGTTTAEMSSWELCSSGGGRAKKVACTGSGDFTATGVDIVLTRISKPTE